MRCPYPCAGARFISVAGIDGLEAVLPDSQVAGGVEAAVRELLRAPRYYRALLPVLFSQPREQAARAEVQRARSAQLDRAIRELSHSGALAEWVRPASLRQRSHLSFSSLQWSAGDLDDDAFLAVALSDACWLLLTATRGETRASLERKVAALEGHLALEAEGEVPAGGARAGAPAGAGALRAAAVPIERDSSLVVGPRVGRAEATGQAQNEPVAPESTPARR